MSHYIMYASNLWSLLHFVLSNLYHVRVHSIYFIYFFFQCVLSPLYLFYITYHFI